MKKRGIVGGKKLTWERRMLLVGEGAVTGSTRAQSHLSTAALTSSCSNITHDIAVSSSTKTAILSKTPSSLETQSLIPPPHCSPALFNLQKAIRKYLQNE